MPYLEKTDLYDRIDQTQNSAWAVPNWGALSVNSGEVHKYPEQVCPSNPEAAFGRLEGSTNFIMADGGGSGNANKTSGGKCYDVCLGPQCAPNKPADCPSANSYCNVGSNWWQGHSNGNSGFELRSTPGIFNPLFDVKMEFQMITDGLSNTFLLLERRPEISHWSAMYARTFQGVLTSIRPNSSSIQSTSTGNGIRGTNNGASSLHTGNLIQACMGDGSVVSFSSDNMDFQVYNNLGNRTDGNVAKL
jgi:hypothetical protein